MEDHGCDRMLVGFSTTCAITAKVASSNHEVNLLQLCDKVWQWLAISLESGAYQHIPNPTLMGSNWIPIYKNEFIIIDSCELQNFPI